MQITIGEGNGWRQVQVIAPVSVLNIDFPFFSPDDVLVQVTVDDITTTMSRGVDYDIAATPGDDGVFPSGVVNLRTPLSNAIATLTRQTAVERQANFPLTGYFDRLSLNAQLNRMTVILQDLRRMELLAIRLSTQDVGQSAKMILPPLDQAPGKALLFDDSGRPYYGQLADFAGIPISTFGSSFVQAADAAAANTLLGMSAYFISLLGAADAAALRAMIGVVDPGQVAPIGTIHEWPGAAEPANFMFCDGRLLDRTTYHLLFDVIGTTYGTTLASNFKLPDRRGTYGAGRDDMGGTAAGKITQAAGGVNGLVLGASGGAQNKTLNINEVPAHAHKYAAQGSTTPSTSGGAVVGVDFGSPTSNTTTSGGGQAYPTLPPTTIMNYIIRYQ